MQNQIEDRIKAFINREEGTHNLRKLYNLFHPDVLQTEYALIYLTCNNVSNIRYILIEYNIGDRAVVVHEKGDEDLVYFDADSVKTGKGYLCTFDQMEKRLGRRL